MAYTIREERGLLVRSLLSVIFALSTVQARAQIPDLFLFDHPVHETWYKKALDACMQSWGDLREVGANLQSELVIIDAAVGRLHFADFCIKNLCAKPTELGDDDILYLWRIMQECDAACAKLEQDPRSKERAECVRTAVQQIRDRLAKYTYTIDEAFFYKDSSMPQPNS